jgi:hypothetical protein
VSCANPVLAAHFNIIHHQQLATTFAVALLDPPPSYERHCTFPESPTLSVAMPDLDPRMMSVQPRIRYNTIGGVNGPLVILENVRACASSTACY